MVGWLVHVSPAGFSSYWSPLLGVETAAQRRRNIVTQPLCHAATPSRNHSVTKLLRHGAAPSRTRSVPGSVTELLCHRADPSHDRSITEPLPYDAYVLYLNTCATALNASIEV